MTATARSALPGKLLTLGVVLAATLSVLALMPVTDADPTQYDGVHDLYGYKITMGLIEPDQVSSVEWDFGDGSEKVTVQITSENPVGSVQHTYVAKGDYVVTAIMRNQYTNSDGQLVDGESRLTYLYHIHGYPIVTFDSNGGSGAPSTDSYTGTSTSSHTFTVSHSEPYRSGYTFLGWSTSSSASSASYTGGDSIAVSYNGSKTLYAVWQENKQYYYAYLYFNANGGSGAPSTQSDSIYASSASGSKTFTIPSTKPTRSGYDFLGWSTSSGAASASYQPGSTILPPPSYSARPRFYYRAWDMDAPYGS